MNTKEQLTTIDTIIDSINKENESLAENTICRENNQALLSLQIAKAWLESKTDESFKPKTDLHAIAKQLVSATRSSLVALDAAIDPSKEEIEDASLEEEPISSTTEDLLEEADIP